MRDIKFRFIYSNGKYSFHKEFSLNEIMNGDPFEVLSDMPMYRDYKMLDKRYQYAGLKDKNGVEIFEGDLINIYYENKEYIFDSVYAVRITPHGVVFDFKKLLWESYGYNQLPIKFAEVSDYGFICNDYKNKNGDRRLCVIGNNEYLYSNYFEVIGNIHKNPELLESEK